MTAGNDRARAYLLGLLAPEEAERVEERYFAADTDFEELVLAEEDLIDDFVDGRLTDEERRSFETVLRGRPELSERVRHRRRLVGGLQRHAANRRSTRRRLQRMAILCGTAAAAVVALVVTNGAENHVTSRSDRPAVPAPTAARPAATSAPPPVLLLLGSGGVRETSSVPTVVLPPAAALRLRIEWAFAGGVPQVVVEDVDGRVSWTGAARREGSHAEVVVPAGTLSPGDYIVRFVSATGEDEAFFRVGAERR